MMNYAVDGAGRHSFPEKGTPVAFTLLSCKNPETMKAEVMDQGVDGRKPCHAYEKHCPISLK